MTENNQVLVRFTISDTNQSRDRLAADNFQVSQGFSLAYFFIYRIQYIFPLKFVQIPKINQGFSVTAKIVFICRFQYILSPPVCKKTENDSVFQVEIKVLKKKLRCIIPALNSGLGGS